MFCFEQGSGVESHTNPSAFDHDSDSGMSGSIPDSTRATIDESAVVEPLRGSQFSLTGSYCPSRAADERRRHRLPRATSPSNHNEQPPCWGPTNVDDTMLDTYVWSAIICTILTWLKTSVQTAVISRNCRLAEGAQYPLSARSGHLLSLGERRWASCRAVFILVLTYGNMVNFSFLWPMTPKLCNPEQYSLKRYISRYIH